MGTYRSIKLFVPSSEKVESLANDLESKCSKEFLVGKVVKYTKRLKGINIEYFDAEGNRCNPDKIFYKFFGFGEKKPIYQAKKGELAHIYVLLTSFKRNFQSMIEILPPSIRRFADLLEEQGLASLEDLTRIGGKNAYTIKLSRYFWGSEDEYTFSSNFDDFSWWLDRPLKDLYSYNEKSRSKHYIKFDSSWLWYIKCRFDVGEGIYDSIPENELSEGIIFNNLNILGELMSTFDVMTNTGALKKGSTVIITKPQMKKILEGFPRYAVFDNRYNPDLSDCMVKMLAISVVKEQGKWMGKRKRINSIPERLKVIYENMVNINDELQLFNEVLPEVKGPTKAGAFATDAGLYVNLLKTLLFKQQNEVWLDVDCILEWIHRNVILNDLPFILRNRGFRWDNWVHTPDKTEIDPCKAMKYLAIPFIRGVLMLFASLGFVELFIKPTAKGEDLFSGIRYVRVTDLGKYVSGVKDSFILASSDKSAYQYDLIDEPLMVVGRDKNNPYNDWLSKVAIKKGLCWIFTPKFFIKDCRSDKDIDNLVSEFKSFICMNPSEAWERFFDSLYMRIGKNVCTSEYIPYTVVKLNPKNKELLEYLASVPNLSDYAIKAENYRLLIERSEYYEFEKLLREGGFII